jgi:hypothetical protein
MRPSELTVSSYSIQYVYVRHGSKHVIESNRFDSHVGRDAMSDAHRGCGHLSLSRLECSMAPSGKKNAKSNVDSSQKDLRSFFGSTQNRGVVGSPPKVHATIFSEGIAINMYRISSYRRLCRSERLRLVRFYCYLSGGLVSSTCR